MADHLGYYLGIMFGPKLESSRFASSRQKNIRKAKTIILKYGTLSIIMGRLIPAVRSLIPLMVGISHLNKIKFTVIDTLACAIWSTGLYLLAGGIVSVFILRIGVTIVVSGVESLLKPEGVVVAVVGREGGLGAGREAGVAVGHVLEARVRPWQLPAKA